MRRLQMTVLVIVSLLMVGGAIDPLYKSPNTGTISDVSPKTPWFAVKGKSGFFCDKGTKFQTKYGKAAKITDLQERMTVEVHFRSNNTGSRYAEKVVILKPVPKVPVAPDGTHWCLKDCECGCPDKECICGGKRCFIYGLEFDNGMYEPSTGRSLYPVPFDPRDKKVKSVANRKSCCE